MTSPFEMHPTLNSEALPKAEDYPDLRDVADYLRKTERGSLLRPDPSRDHHAIERTLLHDLEVATFGGDDAQADEIRRLVWAYSKSREYPEQSLRRAAKTAKELAAELREEPVETRGESPADKEEREQAQNERAERIEDVGEAITLNADAETVRDLLPMLETEFSNAIKQTGAAHRKARKIAEEKLSRYRILRDAAYHALLFPVMNDAKHSNEFGRHRGPRKVA